MKRLAFVLFLALLVSLPARADERIGPEILLDVPTSFVLGGPAVASDGLGGFVVWIADNELRGARIDGAGNVSGPFLLADGTSGTMWGDPAVASNGRGALVAWGDLDGGYADINVILLDTDGRPIHGGPFRIDRGNISQLPIHIHVAFDGLLYRVLWQRYSFGGKHRNFTRRVGPDGSSWTKKVRVKVRGMTPYPYEPNLACLNNGECLVTWMLSTGAERIQGARLVGDQIIDTDVLDLMHGARYHDVVAGDDQYLIVAVQSHYTCGQPQCPVNAAAARVDSGGVALDIDGFTIDNPVGGVVPYVPVVRAAFDGENYLASFMSQPAPSSCAWNDYGARITPGGTVLNPDAPGAVVSDANGVQDIDIAGTRAVAIAAWRDQRNATSCTAFTSASVRAQLAFPHAPVPPLPVRNIGAIGTRSVAEQQVLRFTVGTPGLDPGTTTVSATNMPAGAVFDEATRTFQWLAYPNQSGTYSGVHFEASDASQTINEDVSIDVAEGSLTICGDVDFFGIPMPNVALQLRGGGAKPRTVLSDAGGKFCFFQVIQGVYKLSIDRLSSRDFVADRQSVVVSGGDVEDVLVRVRRRAP